MRRGNEMQMMGNWKGGAAGFERMGIGLKILEQVTGDGLLGRSSHGLVLRPRGGSSEP